MNRLHRTRNPSAGWGSAPGWGQPLPGWGQPLPGWGQPLPGWGQPLPGWSPLIDHGPLPLRMAGSVARWWWPTLTLAGFGTVVGIVLGHDDPTTPGLSTRSLATIALAALVVVLLTIHRTAGPGDLARAAAEYTVVALLAGLLATGGPWSTSSRPTPPSPASPTAPPPRPRPAMTSPPCCGP